LASRGNSPDQAHRTLARPLRSNERLSAGLFAGQEEKGKVAPKVHFGVPHMRVDRDFRELYLPPGEPTSLRDAHTNPRATTLVSVDVTGEEGPMRAGCIELSAGGAQLRVPRLLPVGAEVGLEIDLASERVSVRGVVRSTHIDQDGLEAVGVQFVEPGPHARGLLAAYCDEQNRRQARSATAS